MIMNKITKSFKKHSIDELPENRAKLTFYQVGSGKVPEVLNASTILVIQHHIKCGRGRKAIT